MNIPAEKIRADSMAFLAIPGQPPVFSQPHRPMLDLAHLTSVPPYMSDFRTVITTHNVFKHDVLKNPDVHIIEIKEDLDKCGESMGILLGLQCPPAGLTRERVQHLFDEGVRVISLAYDGPTEYGNGFTVEFDSGLDRKGIELIKWMTEVGMILDVSHASHKTTYAALVFIQRERLPTRVMASHSGCYAVYPHKRNLSDAAIHLIGTMGGYIGIPAVTFLITDSGNNPLDAVVQHIEYALEVNHGGGYLGIGSDCPYVDMTMFEAGINYQRLTRILNTDGRFEEYFPDRPKEIIAHGSQLLEVIRRELQWEKCPGETINGICGGNFLKFLERSLP